MDLRHYVYVSKRKLETFYPQIPAAASGTKTDKVGFDLKVVKMERAVSEEPASDHLKIERLIAHLEANGATGSPFSGRKYIRGKFEAGSLSDGSVVVFAGRDDTDGDKRLDICLVGSAEHMIGWKPPDRTYYYDRNLNREFGSGPAKTRYFELNSNSITFAWSLRDLASANALAGTSEFDLAEINRKRRLEFELTPEQEAAMARRAWANSIVAWCDPDPLDHMFRTLFLGRPLRALIQPLVGKDLWRAKVEALRKRANNANRDIKRILDQADMELLQTASGMTSSVGPRDQYEYFAIRLLSGPIREREVVIASPFFIARIS